MINAALLGLAKPASEFTLQRALTGPAQGFRFPAFMPMWQEYEPSEGHLSNMNTALQFMLLSPADDGLDSGGALLFLAWPCAWDVEFRLAAPRNTIVSGRFVDGRLMDFSVEPVERKEAIMHCAQVPRCLTKKEAPPLLCY